ncbi:MAG: maleylpyruvate isomerase family mycothiol-dependent enzyme [Blastococcus sp.]
MTDAPPFETTLRWWADGERTVADLLAGLTDDDLAAPSALPGWSRATVFAHLARNADALHNLVTWARTGVETPMYPSQEARDAGIAATAALPPAQLRDDVAAAAARFAEAVETMPDEAWAAEVRTRMNRPVPATEVPWMRAKEVWVHAVDLRAGLTFPDLAADFCVVLVDEVAATFAGRGESPDATVTATDVDRTWGSGSATVRGPVTAIAAWWTRGDASGLTGEVPELPAWL